MAKVSGKDGKAVTSSPTSITGASGTTTITVTASGHGLSVGDRVLIEGVGGMTDLNGEHTVTASATTFAVVISSTSQNYTSAGTVKTCATITSWSMDINTEPIKTTDSEVATWDVFIGSGFKGGTGTFEAFFETATSDITLGSSTTLILRMDASNYYTLTAFITANTSTVDVPGSEAVKKTYSFTATSTITPTVA